MMKISSLNPLLGLATYERWKSAWMNQTEVDEYDYISDRCNPEDVLLSCKLLFPDFVESDGGVFLEHKYDSNVVRCWMEKFRGDLRATERVINHTHLYDVFGGCTEDVDDRVFEQLAEVMALSWRLILCDRFPGKKFEVEASKSDQEYGPVVTFYQSTVA